MTVSCFEVGEIERIAVLPDDDPRRMHLGECPRCRSLLKVSRDFSEATVQMPPNTDVEHVRATLSAALDAEIYGRSAPGASESADSWWASWWSALSLRPAFSMAVVVLLAAGAAVVITKPWVETQRPVLRGEGAPAPGQETLGLLPVDHVEGNQVRLRWQPVSDADHYQVVFFAADLTETKRLEPLAATSTLVAWDPTRAALHDGAVLWRVIALRAGDPIAMSSVESISP